MVRSRAVCVAAALLALTACAGGGKRPASVAPLIASSAPSASVATAAPTFPATKQGAADFVRYWFAAEDRATSSGDTSALIGVSEPACRSCQQLTSYFQAAWTRGRIRGGLHEVLSSQTALIDAMGAVVTATTARTALQEVNNAGVVTYHDGAEQRTFLFHLTRHDSSFRVSDYRRA